ncbi:hypothetical protein KZZ52_22335 [Dactylosporangium sp. AC04546]|uniref:hypothetical protein n=1 Tax=Dactylosporangium sp. AC04546 TaxID=2862460 RepID=UPI001EDEE218|nr:hypothetical protein [Dactylosporangium sp. AC04546]WVK88019.1 hypothetical protein KZZ52_22335 [Dactylosporangium sp. AC04546]
MHNVGFALQEVWKVLVVSLVVGAGLPTLFALGVRSLAYGAGAVGDRPARPAGTVIGWLCFAVVLLGVALGITYIVASGLGKTLSFEHIFPTIADK